MRSTLARRQRSVPLAFALIIAVIAGVFTFTTQRGEAHAGVLSHDHTIGPVGLPTARTVTVSSTSVCTTISTQASPRT